MQQWADTLGLAGTVPVMRIPLLGGRVDRPPDDESSWLPACGDGSDGKLLHGTPIREVTDFHRRPETPPGWEFLPSLAFSSVTRRRPLVLHLYRPVDVTVRRPMVLLFHGGGWTGGHPFSHVRRAAQFAARGWAAAAVTYRRATEAPWPAQLDDVHSALDWVRRHATDLGVDTGRIAVGGDSAGGQLAAMAAVDPEQRLSGAVLWYPVTDLAATCGLVDEIDLLTGGSTEVLGAASPITWVRPGGAATLSFAGIDDEVVPIASVRAFHAALSEAGVRNELVELPNAGHAFDFDPNRWAATFETAAQFLDRCFEPAR